MEYPAKAVNETFKIVVKGRNYIGPDTTEEVDFEGLIRKIGGEIADKISIRAFSNKGDTVRKLRRGLEIQFIRR